MPLKLTKDRLWAAILLFLGAAYLVSRLTNLLVLPIFTDESIYIYWAKVIATTHTQWFISLTDGKPPLFIWTIAALLQLLPSNWYLIAGRVASVIYGFFGLFGVYFLGKELFASKRTGLITAILYTLSPFILLYDRMALFDSPLSALLVWSVAMMIRFSRTLNTRDGLLWGFFLGLAFLAKPTAIIFLILTPVVLVILLIKKKPLMSWRKIVIGAFFAVVIALTINNLQRISHVYFLMNLKNQQFQQPLSDLLAHPLGLFVINFPALISWFQSYTTPPVFILGLAAFAWLFYKDFRRGLISLIFFLIPILVFAFVGREIFPRYILFTDIYFLLPLAYLINDLLNKTRTSKAVAIIFLTIVFSFWFVFDYFLLTNPPAAPIPIVDGNQYIFEHPSGYGLARVFTFIDQVRSNSPITIVTQGTFGLYPYAFTLRYWGDPNVKIIPRWPLSVLDGDIYQAQKSSQVYVILKEHNQIPPTLPLKLVLKSEKPGGRYPILVTTLK